MANLLGQNIGTNYKGILNLNTLNGNLSATLQAVTDGDGNASPLQLSTAQARLQRGTTFTDPYLQFRVPDNNSFWLDFRGFNDSGGTYSIFATDRLIIGRNPGLAGFDSATLGLSQTGIFIGGASNGYASARLHLRGDGSNPIALFQNDSPARSFSINQSGEQFNFGSGDVALFVNNGSGSGTISGTGISWATATTSGGGYSARFLNFYNYSATSGTTGLLSIGDLGLTFAASSGSANFRPLNIAYTINNVGTPVSGTATGIFLNATETALNGMGHNLMDLGTGGGTYVSRFVVGRNYDVAFRFNTPITALNWRPVFGFSRIGGTGTPLLTFGAGSGPSGDTAYIASSNDDMFLGTESSNFFTTNIVLKANSAGFIGLGGLTNIFPAIKRNGTGIDFRLADDSGFCNISAAGLTTAGDLTLKRSDNAEVMSFFNTPFVLDFGAGLNRVRFQSQTVCINSAPDASAALTIASTTRGFLPPRQTQAQRTAIASPAIGLIVYQTDTVEGLYVFKSTGWTFIA